MVQSDAQNVSAESLPIGAMNMSEQVTAEHISNITVFAEKWKIQRETGAWKANLSADFYDLFEKIDDEADGFCDDHDADGEAFKAFPASVLKISRYAVKFAKLLDGGVLPFYYGGELFSSLFQSHLDALLPRLETIHAEMDEAVDCWIFDRDSAKADAWLARLNDITVAA